ncbi:MAG: CoA transferase [Calditrichaeota bacterium]|nr:MAG: CoA transferase [Calditrichota bacterium]
MASPDPSHPPPLKGLRILDLTRLYPGPLATMMLAEMGADVIKIEDKIKPDYMRSYPPFVGELSAGYVAVNRSKRSLVLQLNTPRGQEVFFRLVKKADIVVEQFRPGTLDELGLGYEEAIKSNPEIIYVSLTGYGQSGPYANKAGHDINYLGYSGLLSLNAAESHGPVIPGFQIADVAGGAYMTIIACLTALHARNFTGKGQKVDVSMLDGLLPLATLQLAHFQATGQHLSSWELPLSGGLPAYGVFRCADGKYLALGALEPKFWRSFCEMIKKPEWINKLYAMGEEAQRMKEEMKKIFLSRTRDEWLSLQGEQDMCLTPVLGIDELEKDTHIHHRNVLFRKVFPHSGEILGVRVPLHFSHNRLRVPSAPPLLGEHSVEVLREAGFTQEEIQSLVNSGIVLDGRQT